MKTSAAPRTALRQASDRAAHERARLKRRAGRGPVRGQLAAIPDVLHRLGSAEAAVAGHRYHAVVWTVLACVAIATFYPQDASETVAAPPAPTSELAAPADATRPSPSTTDVPGAPLATIPTPPRAPSKDAPFVAPPTSASFTRSAPDNAPPVSTALTPLRVTETAWYTAIQDPGIGGAVPDGTLPIAKRLGGTDKVSVLRLSGTAGILVVDEDPEGAREALGSATLALCPVESAWHEGDAQPLNEAPTWSDTCAPGVERGDRWSFDLRSLGRALAADSFALVPGANAPLDFQVTLKREHRSTS